MRTLALFSLLLVGLLAGPVALADEPPQEVPRQNAAGSETVSQEKAPPTTPATAHRSAAGAMGSLRKNLRPVPTGDAWLDSILNEWSDFALDSVDWILDKFDPAGKPRK